ncbi:MAG TPA: SusC/RagA family TonB-linked outer membrane protein [Puia sp.]|jgi:TonB-linked SusC/RagA family outer membrane protein|nr:SusC/RagA family TonB-linked outer membrane protein [Puia sp.]
MKKIRLLKRLLNSLCLLFILQSSFAQTTEVQRTTTEVQGTITDDKGNPLEGVSITPKGLTTGVTTSSAGYFRISVNPKTKSLVVSYVGYETREISLKGESILTIALERTRSNLDEVVVVGYGTQKRRDLTGSVSSVGGNSIKDLPVTSAAGALQGRAAGVEVIKNSGAPDAQPTIIIRGLSSLHQPNPLYIVDGVQVAVDNINVQDIASIDILKDASAAAIYGSAAAGGVIIITTKKGIGSKPAISFNMRYGVTKPELVSLLDRNGYIKMENVLNPQFFQNATQTDTLANTDWVHTLYRNGNEQNYNLSVSGSSPVVNYLFSGFYNPQKGIFLNNYSNIGGIRINTDFKLGDYIRIGENLALSMRTTSPLGPVESMLKNAPFRSLPIIPLYNEDGTYGTVPPGYGISFGGPNPLGVVNSANLNNTKDYLQGNVYAEIKLPLHLTFKTNVGYSYYNENENYFQNNQNFGPGTPSTNSLNKYSILSTAVLSNYILTYDQTIGKSHINAIIGYEQITSDYNNINSTESAVGLPGYSFVQTSASTISVSGKDDPNGLIKSVFGRLNYNFDNRYLISGSIRQDANYTVFGPNKQKGVFGSVSAGWNIGEEDFFKHNVSFFNSLKLRGSYGSLGNSNIPPYSYVATYSQFNGSSGIANGGQNFAPNAPLLIANSINSVPNPNLHWETVYETDLGIDGEALKGKLYFTLEWYNRITKNMLYALPLPQSSGFTAPYFVNIGEVSSKGYDITLGYRDHAGKFGYDVSVTAGFNKNIVTNLDNITNDALYDGRNYFNNLDQSGYNLMGAAPLTITKAGLPFGSFYGYKVLGIFKTDADAASQTVNGKPAHAGDLQFQDLDKNGVIDGSDRQVIGNPNPKLVYGIHIVLNYEGFDMAALFNGVAGVDLFNGVKAYEQFPFSDGNTTSKIFGDSYFGTNGLTNQPRAIAPDKSLDPNGNYNSVNSYFVENGSYLKLKNLQIGYTFSNSLLSKISVKSARLYVMGNNLFTITKYSGLDPELGSSYSLQSASGFVGTSVGVTTRGVDAVPQYPQTRLYSVGLDVNF